MFFWNIRSPKISFINTICHIDSLNSYKIEFLRRSNKMILVLSNFLLGAICVVYSASLQSSTQGLSSNGTFPSSPNPAANYSPTNSPTSAFFLPAIPFSLVQNGQNGQNDNRNSNPNVPVQPSVSPLPQHPPQVNFPNRSTNSATSRSSANSPITGSFSSVPLNLNGSPSIPSLQNGNQYFYQSSPGLPSTPSGFQHSTPDHSAYPPPNAHLPPNFAGLGNAPVHNIDLLYSYQCSVYSMYSTTHQSLNLDAVPKNIISHLSQSID